MRVQADLDFVSEVTPTKPGWLKIRPPTEKFDEVKQVLRNHNLVTVCEESHCPNMSECWSGGTATFMAMGDTCSRNCRFCQIAASAKLKPLDESEPKNMASAAKEMGISYAVITTVTRDDLEDHGSNHLASCVTELKNKDLLVEILIPDFQGNKEFLKNVLDSKPHVLAHNLETVRRLTPTVRDRRAGYDQTLQVLKNSKSLNPNIYTKSALMVGLGETKEEVIQALKDLREVDCDIITIGQYLRPSEKHLEVKSYVHPDIFKFYEETAKELGFLFVASGPFVRSSYKAGEAFMENLLK